MLRLPSLGELDRGCRRGSICAPRRRTCVRALIAGRAGPGVPGPRSAVGALVPVRFARQGPAEDPLLGRRRLCPLVQAAGGRDVSTAGRGGPGASVELKASELAMLLEGIDLKSIKRTQAV